jgi:transglutaminase-like putative cysteine protease
MKYNIRQVTAYQYASSVPFARHTLRLTPVPTAEQQVLSATVAVEPAPRERIEAEDFFGNRIIQIELETPHRTLTITSRLEVDVTGPAAVDAETTPAWEQVREAAIDSPDLGPWGPVHHLYPSRLVPLDGAIRDYAATSFTPERPVMAAALDLARRIKAEFAYDPAATDVTTPTSEAYKLRRGVCQDFAHVMIAGLRGLGLPAAYVSGYLRTVPKEGRPRLEGADATHAWVAVWCGAEIGWRGFDPTNAIAAGSDHIVVAFGRDYADVSPVDGVIVASGEHTLAVSVDVVPAEEGAVKAEEEADETEPADGA